MGQYDDIKMPRKSLQETAFRKYEKWIGMACRGSVLVDPRDQIPPCKAASFVVGVREAMRGMRLFDYKSREIPLGYELKRIQVHETKDGKVLIENQYEDKVEMEKFREKGPSKTVEVDTEGNIVKQTQKEVIKEVIKIEFKDNARLLEHLEKLQDKAHCEWNYSTVILVHTDGSEQEQKEMKEVTANFVPSDVVCFLETEDLGNGWWRVMN